MFLSLRLLLMLPTLRGGEFLCTWCLWRVLRNCWTVELHVLICFYLHPCLLLLLPMGAVGDVAERCGVDSFSECLLESLVCKLRCAEGFW